MLWTGASPQRYRACHTSINDNKWGIPETYLIVESTLAVQELKELHVCVSSPEVKVANFEVTPD